MTYTPPTPDEARALLRAFSLSSTEAANLCGMASRAMFNRYQSGAAAMPFPVLYVLTHQCLSIPLQPHRWRQQLTKVLP